MYHERSAQASFWLTFVGHDADVLPDAHRRPARHDAARLHLPARARLGRLQPARDDRRLRARGRAAADRRQPRLERASRRAGRAATRSTAGRSSGRPPRRRRTTTSPSSRPSRARTRTGTSDDRDGRPAPARARRARARRRPRDAGVDGERRARSTTSLQMPAESPWPIVARRSRHGRVRAAAHVALRDGRDRSSRLARARPRRLALRTSPRRQVDMQRATRCAHGAAERLVGHGGLRRDRGDALRDAHRHLRLPAASQRALAAAADRAARRADARRC